MTGAHLCLARDARNTLSFSEPITCPLKIKLACFLDLGLLTPHRAFFCQEPGKSPYHSESPGGLLCSDALGERTSQMPVWGPWYTERTVSPSLFFTELPSPVEEASLKRFPKWHTVCVIKANSKGCSHSFVEGRKWGSNVSLSHSYVWTFYVQGICHCNPLSSKHTGLLWMVLVYSSHLTGFGPPAICPVLLEVCFSLSPVYEGWLFLTHLRFLSSWPVSSSVPSTEPP